MPRFQENSTNDTLRNNQTVVSCENQPGTQPTATPADGVSGDARREPMVIRLHRAFGPLAGAMLLDMVDLATLGPIGLVLGPALGGIVGWWVSGIYEFSTRGRLTFAILAAVYCTIPFTEPLPLATAIAAVARFREKPGDGSKPE
jgi:hypothetical protein